MKSLKWQRDEPLKLQFHVITKHTFSRGKKLDRKPGSGLGSGGVSKAGQGEQSTDEGPSIRTPPWVRATEGAGQGQKDWVVTLKRVFICIQRIYSEGLLWAYFRINVVGTYQHLKMWNRRKLRQKMPVRRFVCSKGEVVCVLGCMHELSGLWGGTSCPYSSQETLLVKFQSPPKQAGQGQGPLGGAPAQTALQGSGQTKDGPWVWGWPANEWSRRGAPEKQMSRDEA